jgi:hypothetical protein
MASRDKYTKAERDAWQAQRIAGEKARGLHSAGINALPKAPNPFGREGSLSKQIDRSLQKEANRAAIEKAPKGSTITANIPSTCLESLSWKDGVATATFYRGGAITYEYEVDRETYISWINSGSLGKFGNEEIFD